MFRAKVFLLLLVFPEFSYGEQYFYSNSFKEVEVSNSAPTIFKFRAPAIINNCQPRTTFRFVSMASLTKIEQARVDAYTRREERSEQVNPYIKKMIKVIPNVPEGRAKCAFSLADGSKVGVELILSSNVVSPLIELVPVSESKMSLGSGKNDGLDILRSVIMGHSVSLYEEYPPKHHGNKGRKKWHHSDNAAYRFERILGDGHKFRAFAISGRTNRILNYDELSILNNAQGLIYLSALVPEKPSYLKNTRFKIYILASKNISINEIKRALK